MSQTIEALLVTKGHIFEREPFFRMIDDLQRTQSGALINWTHVEHPAAQLLMHPERAAAFDVIVFYDMPGVLFTKSDPPFAHVEPEAGYIENFEALLADGKGMVFLHHAIAGWPTWPRYAEIIGGRFHFLSGQLGGQTYPGSGYRFNVDQTIDVLQPDHPITAGLSSTFAIKDEVYMFPVLEDDVVPLLRSDYAFEPANFHHGGVGYKQHPTGSSLAGWVRAEGASPITYLQFGHGPAVYQDPNYQTLITNAVAWSASDGARHWAHDWTAGRRQTSTNDQVKQGSEVHA